MWKKATQTQNRLIFWNFLGALISKVLIKNYKFILDSLYFLKVFQNQRKMFAVFEFIT